MAEQKPSGGPKKQDGQKKRSQYKKPMGCFAKLILTIVIIAVLLLIGMAIHFQFILKKSNPDITMKDYLSFTWEKTKDRVVEYKDKALEWKEWLAKSDEAQDFLDKMFPVKKGVEEGAPKVAGDTTGETRPGETAPETGEPVPGTVPGTQPEPEPEPEKEPQPAQKKDIHPEFMAAADEFRAGLVHFKKRENNEAFKRFRKSQDHLENYRKINPDDPDIEKFEAELAPFLHAAMKDSEVR